jgi:putative membrane-bound dehydrogenase-like protein
MKILETATVFYRFLIVPLCLVATATGQAPPGENDSVERDYSAELPRIAAKEPQDALATFEVHEDFQLELAASEPLVRDPVAMAFDEKGRMFVAEMTGYSEKRDEVPGDVRLLEDTDGDGVYDKATTYADNIPWPVAVACYDGGIFVGAAPDILYFKDTDGDGVADVRRVVYTGFKLNNVQGMLNSFNWGLDHRIHGSSSSNGGDITRPEAPGEKALALRGRDFAIDPRSMVMYPEGGGAQHGMSFDDWGRRFVCSNSDHIQLITYDDHYAARNPHLAAPGARVSIAADGAAADVFRISPVEPWRIVRTRLRVKGITPGLIEGGGRAAGYFTSATGVTIYRGDAWPEAYRGNAFIGDVGGNLVHRKTLDADGASLIARRADEGREFIASSDIWFRPVQFANAPDGTLYIADMYRETIEHPDSLPEVIKKHLDLSSGSDRGRIYRIAPKGFKNQPLPDLGKAGNDELIALLSHRNAWRRETAARLINERQDATLAPRLAEAAARAEDELGRMTALYALTGLAKADQELKKSALLTALSDTSAHVRQHAVLLSEPYLADTPALQHKLIGVAAEDLAPVLRLQLAFSLGAFKHPDRAGALGALAAGAEGDSWVRFAVLSSLQEDAVAVFEAYLNAVGDGP